MIRTLLNVISTLLHIDQKSRFGMLVSVAILRIADQALLWFNNKALGNTGCIANRPVVWGLQTWQEK